MPSSRIPWIDFCRVYVAFCVVIRHTDRYPDTLMYFTDMFNFRSLVFFFFLMAGYFTHLAKPGQWLDARRALQLIKPYLFWAAIPSLILLGIQHASEIGNGQWSWINDPGMTLGMLGLRSWLYWDYLNVPLWFLRTLILLAFFSPLLQRIPTQAMLYIIIACFAGSDILCHVDTEAAASTGHRGIPELPFRLYESALALGFYAGGLVLRRFSPPEKLADIVRGYSWLPVILSMALFCGVYFWGFYPPIRSSALVLMGVLTTIGIGCLCGRYLPRFCQAAAQWGPASFFLYVTHFPLLRILRYFLTGDSCGHFTYVQTYLAPAAVTLFSLALFCLLRRFFPRFMEIFALLPMKRKGEPPALSAEGKAQATPN